MAGAKQKPQERSGALVLANRLQRYAPESEKSVRTIQVAKDQNMQKLEKAYREMDCLFGSDSIFITDVDNFYKKMHELLAPFELQTSSSEIERFSLHLESLQSDHYFFGKTGIFLSFLIECSADSDFTVHTLHLDRAVKYIGFRNSKTITVKGHGGEALGAYMEGGSITTNGDTDGDVGYYMNGGMIKVCGDAGSVGVGMRGGAITIMGNGKRIGSGMKGGSIIVKGNVDDLVGNDMHGGSITVEGNAGEHVGWGMNAGSITVKGNAGDWAGYMMEDGSITVEGDAGRGLGFLMKGGTLLAKGTMGGLVGDRMKGGEIHLLGDYESIADNIMHGKIYHKGELIIDK